MLSDGFHRVVGQANNNPPITIGPYQRHFEWHSGQPYWTDGNTTQYPCPVAGYERELSVSNKAWCWKRNGTFHAWDTAPFA